MIPVAFEYVRAGSVDEALSHLSQHGDEAKLLAGGHSLLPLMKLRLATPSVLVDIGRLSDLSYIRDGGDHVAIGALTRHRDVEISELLHSQVPLLAHAAGEVGDNQVRHRGTIGGSISHADPASDLPATLLALDATFVVRGPGGERTVPASQFFKGFFESDLAPTEMMTEIRVPKTGGAGWNFQKFNRRAQDWAIVGVAAWRNGAALGRRPGEHGSHAAAGQRRRAGAGPGSVDHRRGRAGRRGHRAAHRPQRLARVPPPPRQGAGPPGARGRQLLSPGGGRADGTTTHG